MLHSLSFSKHMTTTFHNKLTQLINFLISLGINMLQLWSQVTPMFSPVWELVGEAVILRVWSQARSSSIWELLECCSKVCIIFQESWRTSFIQKQILAYILKLSFPLLEIQVFSHYFLIFDCLLSPLWT